MVAPKFGIPTYAPTYSAPFFDNFDGINLGWTTGNGSNNGANKWEWGLPNFGATNSTHSGPKCWDLNLNTAYTSPADAYLYTPFFNFDSAGISGDPEFIFWRNNNTTLNQDGFTVDYRFNNIGTWVTMGSQSDFICGTEWYNGTLTGGVDGFTGNSDTIPGNVNGWAKTKYRMNSVCVPPMNAAPIVQFRFRFLANSFLPLDGASIDDFMIKIPVPRSVTPLVVFDKDAPELVFPNQHVKFSTKISNEGTDSVSSCTASLYVDNILVSQDLIDLTILGSGGKEPRDTVRTYTFQNAWTAEPGEHKICVITSLPNGLPDLNPANDTTCYNLTVFSNQSTYPYCNNFESGTKWVSVNAVSYANYSTWEVATPAQQTLNSAYSGSKCWTLDADSNYLNSDSSGLFSPLFSVSVFKCYKVSFWHQFLMEQYQDGGTLSYSLDSGSTWVPISFQNSPFTNFFNYNNVSSLAYENGFTGNSYGWRYVEKVIRPNVNDQIIFRWRFAADFDFTAEGWSIDDFCFQDLGPCNVIGIDELSASGLGLGQNYPNPFNGQTTIEYQVPTSGKVQLIFTDALGRMIKMFNEDEAKAGSYTVDFNSNMMKPGIYFYTLIFNGERITKRMMITE